MAFLMWGGRVILLKNLLVFLCSELTANYVDK